MSKINLVEEFGKHINYALEKYPQKFKPFLKNIKLTEYQQFVASIFLLEDYKKMLLFWETGFGKTIFCIYMIDQLFYIYPYWRIYIFVKTSLVNDPWLKTIREYLPEIVQKRIEFFNYDVVDSLNLFITKIKTIFPNERIFFVFDESHDFIKKLIPKENGTMSRRLTPIMEPLINSMNRSLNKTLFMSATPIVDSHKEFLYMMNFLRTGNISLTQKLFSEDNFLLEPSLLKKTCLGVCSYQRRSEPDIFKNASITENLGGKNIIFHKITMSEEQSSIYNMAARIELKSKARGFRTMRKLVNTFVFREIKLKDNIDNAEYEAFLKERFVDFQNEVNGIKFSDNFIDDIKNCTLKIDGETILSKNLNLVNNEERDVYISQPLSSLNEKKNSVIDNLKKLNQYSSKYIKTCQLILQSRGKCIVYQPFVSFEGVKTFLTYLDIFKISYIEYTQRTRTTRSDLIKNFNGSDNINGEKIKVCILSGAGSEGISMTNITDMVIMDIPWSGAQLEQIFGRGIRLNSHKDLPLEKRYTDVHILINYTCTSPINSIDDELLKLLTKKEQKKIELVKILEAASFENIHNHYRDVESIEKTNFYPLISYKYDEERLHKDFVNVKKDFLQISMTFDLSYTKIYEGYLEEDTGKIYENGENTSILCLTPNGKRIFKIIEDKIVYFVRHI